MPGSVPGWGMSWWFYEQGVSAADFAAMDPDARIALVLRYWKAEARGWAPGIPRAEWVGPHHPAEPVHQAQGLPPT